MRAFLVRGICTLGTIIAMRKSIQIAPHSIRNLTVNFSRNKAIYDWCLIGLDNQRAGFRGAGFLWASEDSFSLRPGCRGKVLRGGP